MSVFWVKVTSLILDIFFWGRQERVLMLVGLGAVAFITLLERKYLGLRQIRLGPNKVSFNGTLQPVADGVKLLTKQFIKSGLRQRFLFLVSPTLLLRLFLVTWRIVLLWVGNNLSGQFSVLLFFSVLGCGTYAVILTGWVIISSFAKLGRLRGILQRLSYEVALILVFLLPLLLIRTLSVSLRGLGAYELLLLWCVLWLLLSIIETNRAPFDLLEGERELISGFNIEIGSLIFVFLFLSEYGMIVVISGMLVLIRRGSLLLGVFFFRRVILLARSCYPRVRYDTLMRRIWQCLLPISVVLFRLVLGTK
jgi:NADH:ubiquinone oxidoreductase subunit H